MEEYELCVYVRHELNMDSVIMGWVPFTLDEDPLVTPLRELVYLPEGILDPHELPPGMRRAGKLPDELLEEWQQDKN